MYFLRMAVGLGKMEGYCNRELYEMTGMEERIFGNELRNCTMDKDKYIDVLWTYPNNGRRKCLGKYLGEKYWVQVRKGDVF